MCEYCIQHGSGKKWFENIRNYSRELFSAAYIQEFIHSYFSTAFEERIQRLMKSKTALNDPIALTEHSNSLDKLYSRYLHHAVVTWEELENIYQIAHLLADERPPVARFDCICLRLAGKSDPKKHCYGIAFTADLLKQYPRYLGGVEFLEAEQALEDLRQMSEEEPVVHSVIAMGVPYIGINCNCTIPVCNPYWYRTSAFFVKQAFYKGESTCRVNRERCIGCGTCVEVCPFKIPKLHDERSYINSAECWGCGVCQRNCPENVIDFTPRGLATQLY
ncbi:MAG: 4Fe-4S binding protein [Candidatus Hodarchaeota archaeon]